MTYSSTIDIITYHFLYDNNFEFYSDVYVLEFFSSCIYLKLFTIDTIFIVYLNLLNQITKKKCSVSILLENLIEKGHSKLIAIQINKQKGKGNWCVGIEWVC